MRPGDTKGSLLERLHPSSTGCSRGRSRTTFGEGSRGRVELEQMRRRALVSVSDKRGVVAFARRLSRLGFEIISTGGTAKALEDGRIR